MFSQFFFHSHKRDMFALLDWNGQITTRRTPSRDVDILLQEDERQSYFYKKCSRRYSERSLQRKMRHRHRCKKRHSRFHPYARHSLRDETHERADYDDDSQQGVAVEKYTKERKNSGSSDYSGYEYGFQFSYTIWYKRRQAFLHSVYCFRTGRLKNPSRFIDILYTCGVCFKSFKSKVSLNQHSEELFHWACVRCGRFFESHTALGQHKLALNHTIWLFVYKSC